MPPNGSAFLTWSCRRRPDNARYLHYVCPTGMIFIPCKNGISHNEAESIEPADAEAGARLLAEVAFELAEQPQ